jgi:hypothetical protein
MNRLKYQIFYLAGPMDRVEDRGVEWRQDMKLFLWDELEAGVFDPCNKPIDWGVEDEASRQWRHDSLASAQALSANGHDYEASQICESVSYHMKPVCASDLRLIDQCGAVILHVDTDVHSCGSYAEQTWACLEHKPVVVHCAQGKYGVPDWLWGVCRHEMFFSTWDGVKGYLRHVAFDDNPKHFRRWRFIDMDKVYGKHRS